MCFPITFFRPYLFWLGGDWGWGGQPRPIPSPVPTNRKYIYPPEILFNLQNRHCKFVKTQGKIDIAKFSIFSNIFDIFKKLTSYSFFTVVFEWTCVKLYKPLECHNFSITRKAKNTPPPQKGSASGHPSLDMPLLAQMSGWKCACAGWICSLNLRPWFWDYSKNCITGKLHNYYIILVKQILKILWTWRDQIKTSRIVQMKLHWEFWHWKVLLNTFGIPMTQKVVHMH